MFATEVSRVSVLGRHQLETLTEKWRLSIQLELLSHHRMWGELADILNPVQLQVRLSLEAQHFCQMFNPHPSQLYWLTSDSMLWELKNIFRHILE